MAESEGDEPALISDSESSEAPDDVDARSALADGDGDDVDDDYDQCDLFAELNAMYWTRNLISLDKGGARRKLLTRCPVSRHMCEFSIRLG